MSAQASSGLTPIPIGNSIQPATLRAEMEARRASGRHFDIGEAIGLVVPLCTHLDHLHTQGKKLFVHPSSLGYSHDGCMVVIESLAHTPPSQPRDRACLAPEERNGQEGDARASVFTVGAILYELITNTCVGPAMRHPSELVPNVSLELETILGKALVADPQHRPHDLAALAQALHHIAPNAALEPPPADESHLDHDTGFDIDVSLSMLPPEPGTFTQKNPLGAIPQGRWSQDPTRRLADLKTALEADARARFVVTKEGMDHGPFSAVELLQQIATGAFTEDHLLRDTFLTEQRPIKDWDEFAPFAEQHRLHQDIAQEKKEIVQATIVEQKGMRTKAIVGTAVLGLGIAAGVGWWLRERASHEKEMSIQAEQATLVDVDAGLNSAKTAKPHVGGSRAQGSGNYPVLSGGMSCEAAQAKYVEEYTMGNNGPADLTAGQYGAVLNRGSYLNACGAPKSMSVSVCAAVQNGRAVGVTVTTNPSSPGIASCIAQQVRGLSFPSHPRLDVARTNFAAE